jgi:hypothetical protein
MKYVDEFNDGKHLGTVAAVTTVVPRAWSAPRPVSSCPCIRWPTLPGARYEQSWVRRCRHGGPRAIRHRSRVTRRIGPHTQTPGAVYAARHVRLR